MGSLHGKLPGRLSETQTCHRQEAPHNCRHACLQGEWPHRLLQRSPQPHSRNSRRSVGRSMGEYSAAHPHDGVPFRNQKGQRTWKSHQGTEADMRPQFA